jgi:hypothetical protein
MCGCGGCGHGHGHCRERDYGCGSGRGPYAGFDSPLGPGRGSRDEMLDDLQEYKENLEAEIRRLEKRMGSLREKPPSG